MTWSLHTVSGVRSVTDNQNPNFSEKKRSSQVFYDMSEKITYVPLPQFPRSFQGSPSCCLMRSIYVVITVFVSRMVLLEHGERAAVMAPVTWPEVEELHPVSS